jgi:hypothetical protein
LRGQTPTVRKSVAQKPKQKATTTTPNTTIGTQAAPLIVETHPRAESKEETAKAQKDKEHTALVERWTLAFTGAAAVFTGLLVWVGWRGVRAAIRTLGAIERQIDLQEASQRSWVLVDKADGPNNLDESEDGIPFFVFTLKVIGPTPVKLIDAGMRFHLQPRANMQDTEPALPDPPDYKLGGQLVNLLEPEVVKGPNETFAFGMALEDGRFDNARRIEVYEKRLFPCAYGFVIYEDSFGKRHETRFCYVYRVSYRVMVHKETGKNMFTSRFELGGPGVYNRHTSENQNQKNN